MSRDIPSALESAIEAPVVRPFLAIYIDFPDVVRAWTGQGTIQFADADAVTQSWIGAGGVGAIDTIGESTDGSATGIQASLFNVPSEFRDDIADQAVRGVAFEVYVGALNETFQQVEAATLIWRGRLEEYNVKDAGDSISVEVTGASRGIDQRRPSVKRMTAEYHERMHPGDLFFRYVPQMAEVQILWAAASQNSTASGGGGNANYVTGGGSQSFGGRNAV